MKDLLIDGLFSALFWATVFVLTVGSILFYLLYEILGLFIRPVFVAFSKAFKAVRIFYQNNKKSGYTQL